jgi:predicted lipoprotein with Yx(FWY)xxD motif
MNAPRRFLGLGVAAALFVGACSSADATPVPPTPAPATPAPASSAPAAPPSSGASASGSAASEGSSIGTMSTSLGTVLTGSDGRTLYLHTGDSANTSTCTGGCIAAWPPVTLAAGQQPTAGSGVMGKLATFTAPDGSAWVTYNQLPLYTWQGDAKPGDVTGQGKAGFTVALAAAAAPAAPAASQPAASASSNGYGY